MYICTVMEIVPDSATNVLNPCEYKHWELTFLSEVAKSASEAAGRVSHPMRRNRFFKCSCVDASRVLYRSYWILSASMVNSFAVTLFWRFVNSLVRSLSSSSYSITHIDQTHINTHRDQTSTHRDQTHIHKDTFNTQTTQHQQIQRIPMLSELWET